MISVLLSDVTHQLSITSFLYYLPIAVNQHVTTVDNDCQSSGSLSQSGNNMSYDHIKDLIFLWYAHTLDFRISDSQVISIDRYDHIIRMEWFEEVSHRDQSTVLEPISCGFESLCWITINDHAYEGIEYCHENTVFQ